MKRILTGVLAFALVAPATARAQGARFGLGGGLTLPTGDYGNADKTGWHVLGKIDFHIPMSPIGIRVDGSYGQTSHKTSFAPDGNTKLAGGTVDVVWNVPMAAPMTKPYLFAGAGLYNVNVKSPSLPAIDTSLTKVAFGGGVGLSVGVGPVHAFVEGRFLSVRTEGGATNFIPVTAGVSFGSK